MPHAPFQGSLFGDDLGGPQPPLADADAEGATPPGVQTRGSGTLC